MSFVGSVHEMVSSVARERDSRYLGSGLKFGHARFLL